MSTAGAHSLSPGAGVVEEGGALGGLEPSLLLGMYERMVLARALDERIVTLQRLGRVHFVVSCQGQEGCQVGAAMALRPGHDVALLYYRDMALALAVGVTPLEIMLNVFSRADDPHSGGRQMPFHFSSRRLRLLPASSPVGTQIPQAVGAALACRLRGEKAATLVSFGEGATSTGDFHEGANCAAVLGLGVIFFCQNNRYAISVPQERQMAVASVAQRAAGYGMPGISVDGQDPVAVYRAVSEAAERARSGGGPTLIEARTYRFSPHTSDDDDRTYRSREEVDRERLRDPLATLRRRLLAAGLLTEERDRAIAARAAETVEEAAGQAEAAALPDPATALRHVWHEPDSP